MFETHIYSSPGWTTTSGTLLEDLHLRGMTLHTTAVYDKHQRLHTGDGGGRKFQLPEGNDCCTSNKDSDETFRPVLNSLQLSLHEFKLIKGKNKLSAHLACLPLYGQTAANNAHSLGSRRPTGR